MGWATVELGLGLGWISVQVELGLRVSKFGSGFGRKESGLGLVWVCERVHLIREAGHTVACSTEDKIVFHEHRASVPEQAWGLE